MGWITVYIAGKSDFKEEVLRHLENSKFRFMPGSAEGRELSLFWIDERDSLREFKKSIGSKIIFKYRLRFYTRVEELVESKSKTKTTDQFTAFEESMIRDMTTREETSRVALLQAS